MTIVSQRTLTWTMNRALSAVLGLFRFSTVHPCKILLEYFVNSFILDSTILNSNILDSTIFEFKHWIHHLWIHPSWIPRLNSAILDSAIFDSTIICHYWKALLWYLFQSKQMKARDCYDLYQTGFNTSGAYQIFPDPSQTNGTNVYCDMTTQGGGWTVSDLCLTFITE